MQNRQTILLRRSVIKYRLILLLWTLFLIFAFNIYNQGGSYMEFSPKFKRESKYEEIRKVLGAFSEHTKFPEIKKVLGDFSESTKFPEIKSDVKDARDFTNDELIAVIEEELPSLSFRFWYQNKSKKFEMSPNCAKFPDLFHLNYFNKYWQTFQLENITFQLFSAYYDNRPTVDIGPTVRLLAMINTTQERLPEFYCQLWYNEQLQPKFTTASLRMIWYSAWGNGRDYLYPHLVTCSLPTDAKERIPKVVSLVSTKCERAKNSLRVIYEQPQAPNVKQQFAVCVKGLDYPNIDISARLIEWIEMQQILGASKIFFYLMQVHPNVSKVLQHYVKRGIVDVKPITLGDGVPYTPQLLHFALCLRPQTRRLNEIIPFNDCLYRNIYNYDYIALEAIDEVIMPLGNLTTWAELVELAAQNRTDNCKNGYASYCFRNVYFPDFTNNETGLLYYPEGVPNHLHMLKHVQRSTQPVQEGPKCLHRTDRVLSLHNHYPVSWLNVCPSVTLPEEIARLNHYRHVDMKNSLTDSAKDMDLWRFKDILLERTMKAFEEILLVTDDSSD